MAIGDVTKEGRIFVYETERGAHVRVSPHQEFQATPRRRIPGYRKWQEVPHRRLDSYYPAHRIRVVLE
ncbi:MAG: hypothetical protein GF368_03600 [Candidatus Aenigmarchaeota archaeon]|nr:hypothetical protein [Candidatus Aenigmarchaeota archaeon]